jgi:hypothetical protein
VLIEVPTYCGGPPFESLVVCTRSTPDDGAPLEHVVCLIRTFVGVYSVGILYYYSFVHGCDIL